MKKNGLAFVCLMFAALPAAADRLEYEWSYTFDAVCFPGFTTPVIPSTLRSGTPITDVVLTKFDEDGVFQWELTQGCYPIVNAQPGYRAHVR